METDCIEAQISSKISGGKEVAKRHGSAVTLPRPICEDTCDALLLRGRMRCSTEIVLDIGALQESTWFDPSAGYDTDLDGWGQ